MPNRFPFAHTFSIVARDPINGDLGAAVQSHWFSTGALVTYAEAGVGAVATQAMIEPSYGPLGLTLMRAGKSAPLALQALLSADEERDIRQVAMIDTTGRVATHTGARCIPAAGHISGDHFSVQANMMANDSIWPAMDAAYRASTGPLASRMLAALEAAQAAGGDIRGQQSAAMIVVKGISSGRPWADRIIDLRVDDHSTPLAELKRLLRLAEAYNLMNAGDEELGGGRTEAALASYRAAAALAPEVDEMPFWHAVTLADLGRLEEALPIFARVFAADVHWKELLRRLPAVGLFQAEPIALEKILGL